MRDIERHVKRERDIWRYRERLRVWETEIYRETERERERDRETDRERLRERDIERLRERERESSLQSGNRRWSGMDSPSSNPMLEVNSD